MSDCVTPSPLSFGKIILPKNDIFSVPFSVPLSPVIPPFGISIYINLLLLFYTFKTPGVKRDKRGDAPPVSPSPMRCVALALGGQSHKFPPIFLPIFL